MLRCITSSRVPSSLVINSSIVSSSGVTCSAAALQFASARHVTGRERNKQRAAQIDKIFRSRSSHSAEKRRVVSAESDARAGRSKSQLQLQQRQQQQARAGLSRPVTLLDDPALDEQDGLFRPAPDQGEQEGGEETKSTELATVGAADLLAAPPSESTMSVLVDDAFSYLPEVSDPEPAVVPGESFALPGLVRMRFDIQFRGNHFFGWNRKAEVRHRKRFDDAASSIAATLHDQNAIMARSVKNAIDEALLAALDLPKFPSDEGVVPSCILETGVHARRLTCHVDIPADIMMQPRTVLQRAHLWLHKSNDPLAILNFEPAPRGFHARHSVKRRVFVYRMLNRVAPPLFDMGLQWHVDRSLDVPRMNEACQLLQGRQDYTAFADPKIVPQLLAHAASGVRELDEVKVTRQEDEVFVWFVGRSFLRHQLRYMTSVLKLVGQGQWNDDTLEQFIKGPAEHTANLKMTGQKFAERPLMAWKHLQPVPAPSHGLWLWSADYSTGEEEEGNHVSASASAKPAQFVDSGPVEARFS